jgi:hypothetical protein
MHHMDGRSGRLGRLRREGEGAVRGFGFVETYDEGSRHALISFPKKACLLETSEMCLRCYEKSRDRVFLPPRCRALAAFPVNFTAGGFNRLMVDLS